MKSLVLVLLFHRLPFSAGFHGCERDFSPKRKNLALHKPAQQSTTFNDNSVASKAVDGISHSSTTECGSCTSTVNQDSPWWMVDLGQQYVIQEVAITNRDTLSHRLRNFDIEIAAEASGQNMTSPVLCGHRADELGPSETVTFQCQYGDTLGRYVKILGGSRILTLCEVKVFGPYYVYPNETLDRVCEVKFRLERNGYKPRIPPIVTTEHYSKAFCAVRCQLTEACVSFTIKHTLEDVWECNLYDCNAVRTSVAEGYYYFKQLGPI